MVGLLGRHSTLLSVWGEPQCPTGSTCATSLHPPGRIHPKWSPGHFQWSFLSWGMSWWCYDGGEWNSYVQILSIQVLSPGSGLKFGVGLKQGKEALPPRIMCGITRTRKSVSWCLQTHSYQHIVLGVDLSTSYVHKLDMSCTELPRMKIVFIWASKLSPGNPLSRVSDSCHLWTLRYLPWCLHPYIISHFSFWVRTPLLSIFSVLLELAGKPQPLLTVTVMPMEK
jgi:hypothetical protein